MTLIREVFFLLYKHVFRHFLASPLSINNRLNDDQPRLNVTINQQCHDSNEYNVTVMLGWKAKGTDTCNFLECNETALKPGSSETFFLNKKRELGDSEEYCYNATLWDHCKLLLFKSFSEQSDQISQSTLVLCI